jgi:serine/threonine protein kinase
MSLCINSNCQKPSNPDTHLYCQSCGSELLLKGRYRVTRLLSAKGGFGNTYEVRENNDLKVLKVLINDHPHSLELFQQEALVLSKLKHPGIPKGEGIFTYFARDSKTPLHCLLMEKIEGVDLEEYLKQRNFNPIEEPLALQWLFQLTDILGEVHRQNLFHRDIKPSNIILKPNGQLVLIDFGAARQVTATILAGGQNTQIYTSGYAPPEQEKGYAVQQSDFFALGRTFVFLLTGKDPKDKAIYDYYNNELNWRKYASHIAPQLANFLDELMAEKATQRPASISIILKRLKDLEKELLSSSKPSLATQLSQLSATPIFQTPISGQFSPQYAGFWLRFKASLIDRTIVTIMAAILGGGLSWYLNQKGIFTDLNLVFNFSIQELILYSSFWTVFGTTIIGLVFTAINLIAFVTEPTSFLQEDRNVLFLATLILGICFQWFYFIFLEASWLKTTLGKMMVGIWVTNEEGKRISLKQANQRYWGKILSMLPLYIGFMMAGWTKKKQALHDRISGTFIVKKKNKNH